jgi:hypothetical protein
MTSNELKELVKTHFALVEKAVFGEVMDENKAFTILFEGDVLEVGKEVKVRTTDGQELTAPDGYHKLENGKTIKVENGVVVEITDSTAEEAETELAIDGEVEQPAQIEGVEVEKSGDKVMTSASFEEVIDTETEDGKTPIEDIVSAVAEVVKREIDDMKAELAEMKKKMASYEDAPATEKVMPSMMSNDKTFKPTAGVFNEERFNLVMERFSNKK